MGDAWDAFSFIEADRGKQGSCGHKKDPLPLSLLDPGKDIAAEHRSRAAAAASSCVGILVLPSKISMPQSMYRLSMSWPAFKR